VDKVRQLFTQLISRPQGLVLISGPTGSGKTTTLYSALHARRRPELNVVTVEDPIEYHLDGVTQVQVHPEAGVTFASVLRALLRQDPNIIMVGETRDLETARMAIEASMTGHLVLTSVHSNGAVEAVGRLADLGIERYAIANGLVGVLHQRLVRKNCPACREPMDYPESVVENLLKVGAFRAGEKLTLQRGRGCGSCGNTGFKGRIALYELLLITDTVRDAIGGTGELSQLRPVARAAGALVDMPRYAGALMALGHTAPGEVLHLVLRVGG
jgi:type IV pilus assembly protein PilB